MQVSAACATVPHNSALSFLLALLSWTTQSRHTILCWPCSPRPHNDHALFFVGFGNEQHINSAISFVTYLRTSVEFDSIISPNRTGTLGGSLHSTQGATGCITSTTINSWSRSSRLSDSIHAPRLRPSASRRDSTEDGAMSLLPSARQSCAPVPGGVIQRRGVDVYYQLLACGCVEKRK